MTQWLKQSTATNRKIGPFIDDTDGKTAETGLTTAYTLIYLSKNGDALTAKHETTAIAHDALGYYLCKFDATDTNTLGSLRVATHVAGHLPVWQDFMVVPANVWDSFFGASLLGVDVTNWKTAAAPAMTGDAFAAIGDVHATDLPAVTAMLTDIHGTDLPAVKADTAAILTDTGTTLDAALTLALKLLRNKVVTNPATGVMTVYDDNGTSVLYTANVYADVAGAMPFIGTGANRRDRLA